MKRIYFKLLTALVAKFGKDGVLEVEDLPVGEGETADVNWTFVFESSCGPESVTLMLDKIAVEGDDIRFTWTDDLGQYRNEELLSETSDSFWGNRKMQFIIDELQDFIDTAMPAARKKYSVSFEYDAKRTVEVEAYSEDDAIDKAMNTPLSSLDELDSIEVNPDYWQINKDR